MTGKKGRCGTGAGGNGKCVDGDGNDEGNDDDVTASDGDDGDELACDERARWETDVDRVMLSCVVSMQERFKPTSRNKENFRIYLSQI